MKKTFLKGTKALVMGLGVHGGGLATTKWLLAHGAQVTVTDKRSREQLASAIQQLSKLPVHFVLGEHREEDFLNHDLIVVNPGVPRESPYLAIAKKAGKRLENDASLFFRYLANTSIGITGTRGKTTTTQWITQLLSKKFPEIRASGNTPENALLKEFERVNGKAIPTVAELSSWQLEYLPVSEKAPHIALITNIYRDHMNRYSGMEDYANAKANIFEFQNEDDFLVLNHDNAWYRHFLSKHPKAKVLYISKKILPKRLDGIYIHNHHAVIRYANREHVLYSITKFQHAFGEHNVENVLAATLAVFLFDQKILVREKEILGLRAPRMREEVIFERGKLKIINDSCATSPDGTIAALSRYHKEGRVILIAGGTDKALEFSELARNIKKMLPKDQLILLEGSATKVLSQVLANIKYQAPLPCATLKECVETAFARVKKNEKTIIVFSPGAASFEKFLHEFDRGEQFALLVKNTTARRK